MEQDNRKPDSVDNLYKQEEYVVIQPFRSNSDIFNKKDFDVDMFWQDDRRIVVIRRKGETK